MELKKKTSLTSSLMHIRSKAVVSEHVLKGGNSIESHLNFPKILTVKDQLESFSLTLILLKIDPFMMCFTFWCMLFPGINP